MDIVFPRAQTLLDLAAMIGAVPYSTAKLHLYSNDLTPTVTTVLADFTEVIASGVVAKSVTWSAPFYDVNNLAVSSGGELLFAQTGATPDFCYGAYLTDLAGAVLLWSARLDSAPFNFAAAGDSLPIVLKMGLDFGIMDRSPVP